MLVAASLCWLGANDCRFDLAINALLIVVAQASAIYVCYCVNTHGDGRDFWMRFYTLGVPVALRLACVLTPIIFFASLPPYTWKSMLGNSAGMMQVLSDLPNVVVLACGILAWGWRVSVHIEQAARGLR
jgi:hypothetical protein